MAALSRLWQSTLHRHDAARAGWEQDIKVLYDRGLGLQEVLEYLYRERPSLEQFLQWSQAHQPVASLKATTEDVLSETDLNHWNQHGYVVLREAVPPDQHQAANKAIWEFLGADPADPESWYHPHPAKNGLMVLLTHHPALRVIRNSPRIRKAFEQLYGQSSIYPVVDKVSFNPPETPRYTFAGSPLHWDTSLEWPIPFRLQGLIYLTDVSAQGGAFQCVPGFHLRIGTWLDQLPDGVEPRQYALQTLKPVPIPGQAGDLIIWHQALPHCASPNLDLAPRLVQYLTYLPEGFEDPRPWR